MQYHLVGHCARRLHSLHDLPMVDTAPPRRPRPAAYGPRRARAQYNRASVFWSERPRLAMLGLQSKGACARGNLGNLTSRSAEVNLRSLRNSM